jgi:hypothetical protein
MLINNPIRDISHNANRYLKNIKRLTYLYIMMILFKLLFGDFSYIMMDVFLILMLYCLFTNVNHLFIPWIIFSIVMTGFDILIVLLFFIQNIYLGFFVITPIVTIYVVILISELILFLILINNCFLLYKECRSIYRTIFRQGILY